ncbi:MAG: hypothetical protein RL368_919 [Pseudomonadota bacterium]|jgi:uncharacterized protein
MNTIAQRIAQELSVQETQVLATIALLDEGATVPFIARYRKEATGGLDDTQLRNLEERLRYLRELDERRETILNSIQEQQKLTPELNAAILAAATKTELEDLYLPYKLKRRTKAQIAKEAGLEPLALGLLADPTLVPEVAAAAYLAPEKGIAEIKEALDGARQILMEKFAEAAELIGQMREFWWENAWLFAKVVDGKQEEGAKFSDYFEHSELLKNIPSHRALALYRGRNEGILSLHLALESEDSLTSHPCEGRIAAYFQVADQQRPADKWLLDCVRWAWKFKIRLSLDVDILMRLRELSESEAIKVFSLNLKDLLLAAPAGPRTTLGLDPGLRTGVKVAVVDNTGKLLECSTIYPHAPRNDWDNAIHSLGVLAKKYGVELISIGNGTASRETDKLAGELIKLHPELKLSKLVVSEAGASVYSASEFAANEFPELDVSLRGAVSIARRLQDPLAELVKIDPKSIGVGQYQHDVSQTQLARSLDAVVEDCVNAVGVDVNMASIPLLSRVSGLNAGLARNIVSYRDANGVFASRDDLKQVPRLGAKTFEQAAGFLRIMNGSNPLDASAVHPETYSVVKRIAEKSQRPLHSLIGDVAFLRKLNPADFTDLHFGIPTVTDILNELEKPGRDPRPELKTANFQEGVEKLEDLQPEMLLEGVVTNVTNFGAFVDIGVHQDGLVHISALSDSYVKDPRDIVKTGDVVKVKVLEIDLKRKRIALTMRLQDSGKERAAAPARDNRSGEKPAARSGDKPARRDGGAGAGKPRSNAGGGANKQPVKFSSGDKISEMDTAFGSALAAALNRKPS